MFRPLRQPLRQCLRPIHTSPPRYSSPVDWKSPFQALRIRSPYSAAAGCVALTFFLTFPLWFKQPLPPTSSSQNDDLPAPVRGDSQIQSTTNPPSVILRSVVDNTVPFTENFPEKIEVEGKRYRLVAWGVRTISFLRIQVYNVGLYIPENEYVVLPTYTLSNITSEPWSTFIRILSYPLILRIIPVRNTDYSHLRDGFIKSITARLKKYPDNDERKEFVEKSIVEFKGLFPKSKLKKGDVLSIMQDGPSLRLFEGGNMGEKLGSVRNDDLARGLMDAYLVGENVVSPDLQKKLRAKILEIADLQQKEDEAKKYQNVC